MHLEILTENQHQLLSLVSKFSDQFGLVGGTAIALHLGHRESIDFDLFTYDSFNNAKVKRKIKNHSDFMIGRVYKDENGQFTFN